MQKFSNKRIYIKPNLYSPTYADGCKIGFFWGVVATCGFISFFLNYIPLAQP